jgi:hypothetical protein
LATPMQPVRRARLQCSANSKGGGEHVTIVMTLKRGRGEDVGVGGGETLAEQPQRTRTAGPLPPWPSASAGDDHVSESPRPLPLVRP